MEWIEYYKKLCEIVAIKSKDCHKVGSILVDKDRHIILGIGFNGAPQGYDESGIDWHVSGLSSNKHEHVIHSEFNSVLNCAINTKTYNGTIQSFTTLAPCPSCVRFLVQAGVKEIYFWNRWTLTDKAEEVAKRCGVIYEQLPS